MICSHCKDRGLEPSGDGGLLPCHVCSNPAWLKQRIREIDPGPLDDYQRERVEKCRNDLRGDPLPVHLRIVDAQFLLALIDRVWPPERE